MNNKSNQDSSLPQEKLQKNPQEHLSLDELPLTDDIVSTYLQDDPEFFSRNSHLMIGLRLADEQRGTVSLVERQQQQLRQKLHSLEDEITQLMSVANHNERLFVLYSDLYLRLLDCQSILELLDCLHQATTELLSLSAFKVWLIDENNNTDTLEHPCLISADCSEILASKLAGNDYYFGRIQQSEQALIFSHDFSGSVVLIKLTHHDKTLGFITISSDDAQHFDPHMDTLLLSQFKKLVAKLLQQQLSL